MKKNIKYILIIAALIILYIFGLRHANTQLTYLEYETVTRESESSIELNNNNSDFIQKFKMPYNILKTVAIHVDGSLVGSDSIWKISLKDESGKVLKEERFASGATLYNLEYHKNRINVDKGQQYYVAIIDENGKDLSKIAENIEVVIYGGDVDYWWHGLYSILFLYLLFIVAKFWYNEKKNKSFKEDKVLQGMILGAIAFVLLFTFSFVGNSFVDENDNIRGGMVIADGGVLYKDYVTQHTPILYYLCSIFALLGAGSVEQFRLSYYIFECIIWIIVYIRHKDYFGAKKMALLPIMEVIFIYCVVPIEGIRILSDSFEGLMFVLLILEFLRYYKDRTLKLDRSIIISISVWASFGAAFISVYAMFFVGVLFICLEIISLIVPPILAIIYFAANDALGIAFRQFYTFNTEIYSKYTGVGSNGIIQPFGDAINNVFEFFAQNFVLIITASSSVDVVVRFVLMTFAACIIVRLLERKRVIEGIALATIAIFSASRTEGAYEFHGLAAWYMVILIVVLFVDVLFGKKKRISKPLVVVTGIVLSSTFFITMVTNVLYPIQLSSTPAEAEIVQISKEFENKDIYIDASADGCDSIYLYYKGCKPVNSAVYMLPWYMEWFEESDADELKESMPNVALYDLERESWSRTHYTNTFDRVLKENYLPLSSTDWKSKIWVKK